MTRSRLCLPYFLLFTLLCTCSPEPVSEEQTDYFLVTNNTRGLREGFLEIGNVVSFSDSTMVVREPGHMDWSRTYRFRGDSLDGEAYGRWYLRGDSLLAGPDDNDYALQLLSPQTDVLLDSLVAGGVRYRSRTTFVRGFNTYQFLPADSSGHGCFTRYVAETAKYQLPDDFASLPKKVQRMLDVYRAVPPEYGTYGYDTRFGRPLLVTNLDRARSVLDVQSTSADSLVIRQYSNLSPASVRSRDLTWERIRDTTTIDLPAGPSTWVPAEDPRLDSISWSNHSEDRVNNRMGEAIMDFDLANARIEYRMGELMLLVGDRQIWRRAVYRSAPDLLRSDGEGCRSARVYPLMRGAEGEVLLLVPLTLRRPAETTSIPQLGQTFDRVGTQFRMQPFRVLPE